VIDKRVKAVSGIADVISFGGEVKTYEVNTQSQSPNFFSTSVPRMFFTPCRANNANIGGDVIEGGPQTYLVRGLGLVASTRDIESDHH